MSWTFEFLARWLTAGLAATLAALLLVEVIA
ncbi:hypothetical protein BJ1_gp27 [Halorubrum virus BJ1]|uniref:Uncharacterized protein n=1 Tax=Halorubrum virus BJ1 TaxID=416419 RepID=A0ZYP0_9CAUD|nr:hypothetical protein BJ1_gp27 [Halorubrum virus BJ1]CAL92449.1 hypothetical protein [Halorubrum virus BJ1]